MMSRPVASRYRKAPIRSGLRVARDGNQNRLEWSAAGLGGEKGGTASSTSPFDGRGYFCILEGFCDENVPSRVENGASGTG